MKLDKTSSFLTIFLASPIDQKIEYARAKHIGQSMHEEEWQEVLDHLFVENIIEESIDDTDDHCPKQTLVGMEGNPNQGRISQGPPLVLLINRCHDS